MYGEIMPDEATRRLLRSITPEECEGCYRPAFERYQLSKDVASGIMELSGAVEAYRSTFSTCEGAQPIANSRETICQLPVLKAQNVA